MVAAAYCWVVDNCRISVGMIVDEDVEALSCKVAHNIQEAGVDRVIRDIIIAHTTYTVGGWRGHLQNNSDCLASL